LSILFVVSYLYNCSISITEGSGELSGTKLPHVVWAGHYIATCQLRSRECIILLWSKLDIILAVCCMDNFLQNIVKLVCRNT